MNTRIYLNVENSIIIRAQRAMIASAERFCIFDDVDDLVLFSREQFQSVEAIPGRFRSVWAIGQTFCGTMT